MIIFLLLAILSSFLFLHRYQEIEEDNQQSNRILVNDQSRFFTISNAANSYINFLAQRNTESLLLLLCDEYIEQNNLNRGNVLNHLDDLTGDFYNFRSRLIYQSSLSENIIKYYIYGHLREERLDEYVEAIPFYLILLLDINNWIFSIIPYEGTSFMEAINANN